MNNSVNELNFSIEGSGPNLVLLHGFLESNKMWEPLQLEKDFTCIKIELPGHGGSLVENIEQTISFMAECVKLTLNSLKIEGFNLIGHSLGGYVALEYISQFDLTGKLILLHSNFWEDDAQKKIDRQRVANIVQKNKGLFLSEALPALFVEPRKHFTVINALIIEAKKMTAEAIADCSLAMQKRQDHSKTMKKFSSEISIIQGEIDRLIPVDKMQEMLKGLKNEMIVIPDSGHMGQHENTIKVRSTILKLLQ